MKKEAIYHRMLSEMAAGLDDGTIVFRLRTARDDVESVTLLFGDRSSRTDPIPLIESKMEIIGSTKVWDWYEVVLKCPYMRVCYAFKIVGSAGEVAYYYGDQIEDELPLARSEYFQIPYNHRADRAKIPSWLPDAIVYNVFPDSFASGRRCIAGSAEDRYFEGEICRGWRGGTINGIRANLDYIAGMGFNTLYMNPIFAAGEYHKYDTIDYYHVDPVFGTNEDFRKLVEDCHRRNMHVIIDGVFNHAGWHFIGFKDCIEKGKASRYWSWFHRLEEPVIVPDNWDVYPGYECFGYERMMPKLAMDNPETSDYFCNVGSYWVREFGIDGWRLDVADEVPDVFWRKFRNAVKSVNPECALIGEVWVNANHWLDGSMFDSVMNYDIWRHGKRFFADMSIDAEEFDSRVTDMRTRYRIQHLYGGMNLLDSHDISRFYSLCGESYEKWRLAEVFLFTFPGMPTVFYGDEKGIPGILEKDFRQAMSWDRPDGQMHSLISKLAAIRTEHESLRRGTYRTVKTEDGFYSYSRENDNERIIIALNRNNFTVPMECDDVIFSEGLDGDVLSSMGFAIYREREN